MNEVEFAAGSIIFREGDDADFAYLIRGGQVEILKRTSGGDIPVALLGPGDIFGEMGIIDERPRSATARAVHDVRAGTLDQRTFVDMILASPRESLGVLRSLCERLRTITDHVRDIEEQKVGTRVRVGRVLFWPPTSAVSDRDADGLQINHFPFRVGRQPAPGEGQTLAYNDQQFPDTEPYALSLNHFLLDLGLQGVICRDRGSRRGTRVNGVEIGGKSGRFSHPLKFSDNEIVAGGEGSPFQFRVRVEMR